MRERRAAKLIAGDSVSMTINADLRPGDKILDKYVPHLTEDEREAARAQLYAFVAWQMRILARQHREQLDSRDQQERDTLQPLP